MSFSPLGRPASLFVLLVSALGCRNVNTVPEPVSPAAAVQQLELEIPEGLEVRTVDFSASMYSDVSGNQYLVQSSGSGRAFLTVHAIDKRTGESVVLLYENFKERKRPVQQIRLRQGGGR